MERAAALDKLFRSLFFVRFVSLVVCEQSVILVLVFFGVFGALDILGCVCILGGVRVNFTIERFSGVYPHGSIDTLAL